MMLSRRALLAASAAWLGGCASQPEPTPARLAPEAYSEGPASRVPVAFDRSGLLLPLLIAGYRFWGTVDTGSSATVLARPLAGLCARELASVRAYAQTGVREMARCSIGSVELGPVRFDDVSALIEERRGDRAVFIGLDILNRVVIDVDLDAQSADVHAPGSEPPFDGRPLRLIRRGHGAYLPIEIGGERELAMVDTGHAGTISVDAAYAMRRGFGSRGGQATVVLPRVVVDGVALDAQPVRIVDHINFANIGCVALIGAGFLFDGMQRVRLALGENVIVVAGSASA